MIRTLARLPLGLRRAGGWPASAMAVAILALGTLAAQATEPGETDAPALRLNFADRQLMLNEMIAKSLCLTDRRINRSHFRNQLATAKIAFRATFDQLTEGSRGLSLAREHRSQIRSAIDGLKADWIAYASAINGWAGARWGKELFAMKAYEVSGQFDRQLEALMELYETDYANSALLPPDIQTALLLSGQQRRLTQKLGKELCWLRANYEAEATRQSLARSLERFEESLARFRTGGAAAGLPENPPGMLSDVIEYSAREFAKVKPVLTAATKGTVPEIGDLQLATSQLDNVLKSWVEITSLYGMMHRSRN